MILLKWVGADDYYIYSPTRELYWYVGHRPMVLEDNDIDRTFGSGWQLPRRSYHDLLRNGTWEIYEYKPYLRLQEGL